MFVDIEVCKRKFDLELEQFRKLEENFQQRGCFLVSETFPQAFLIFSAPQISPPPVVIGAVLDFSNYDLVAPSVRFAHPFTRKLLKAQELTLSLPYLHPVVNASDNSTQMSLGEYVQVQDENSLPFICIPGIREYHEHPAHSGDNWLLHRGSGKGTLFYIADFIHRFGIAGLLHLNYQINMKFIGYVRSNPIEA